VLGCEIYQHGGWYLHYLSVFLEERRMFCNDDRESGWRYWTTLAMIAAIGLFGVAMLLLVHV